MIRMVLYAVGFISVTLLLILFQPGSRPTIFKDEFSNVAQTTQGPETSNMRVGEGAAQDAAVKPLIERAVQEALLTVVQSKLSPIAGQGLQADPLSNVPVDEEVTLLPKELVVGSAQRGRSEQLDLDDRALRQLTWETMSSLNVATGKSKAPGEPGSLLATIVRRSMGGTGLPSGEGDAQDSGIYVVQPGDSLISISMAIYGNVEMIGALFNANNDHIADPDSLKVGQTLVLPDR